MNKKFLSVLSLSVLMVAGNSFVNSNTVKTARANENLPLIGEHDASANVSNDSASAAYGSKRTGIESFMVTTNIGWGQRVSSIMTYDISDFQLKLDLSNIATKDVVMLSFGQKDSYPTDRSSIGLDIYKISDTEVLTTFYNGTSGVHNNSMAGYGTTNYDTYVGQQSLLDNGVWSFSLKKGADLTTVITNGTSVDLANETVFLDAVATTNHHISFGVQGASGATTGTIEILEMKDVAEKNYLSAEGTFGSALALVTEMTETINQYGVITKSKFDEYFVTNYFEHDGKLGHAIALSDYVHGYDKVYLQEVYLTNLTSYKESGKYINDINYDYTIIPEVGVHDLAANFAGFTAGGAYGSKRTGMNSMLLSVNHGWGNRASTINNYDLSDFEMTINFDEILQNQLLLMAFGDPDCYPTAGAKLIMDMWKMNDESIFMTISTGDHNISIPAFGTENNAGFTGRYVKFDMNGNITIKIKKVDEENAKITLNENEFIVPVAQLFANMNGGNTAGNHIIFGGINNGGVTKPTLDFYVDNILDANQREYEAALEDKISARKESMASKTNALVGGIAEGGLTDATLVAYKTQAEALIAEFEALDGLLQNDYVYYIKDLAVENIAKLNAPLQAYNDAVAASKLAAIASLNAYVSADDYREAEQAQRTSIIEEYTAKINAEESLTGVENVLTEAKGKLDELKTKAQYEAEEALASAITAAKDEITSYLNLENYRDEQLTEITTILNKYKTALNNCKTIDEVTKTVVDAKAELDAVKTDAELTQEEEAAAALATAKSNAIAELEGYIKDKTKYSAENQKEIDRIINTAKTSIQNATTESEVSTILANAKTQLDAIEMKKGGCGGSVIATTSLIGMLALLGIGVGIKLKKEEK